MLDTTEWNALIRSIKAEKCVVIMGLEASQPPLLPQFLNQIGYPDNSPIRFVEDELFFFAKADTKSPYLVRGEWQEFLKEQPILPFMEQLSQIPFHVCLNLSPDARLKKAFEKQEFDFAFDYYQKNKATAALSDKPTKDKPLIYNLMGTIEESNSIVFTQEDTFDYLISIFGDYPLTNLLKKELLAAENILFLGVSIHKWYMKMLMKMLEDGKVSKIGTALGKYEHLNADLNTQSFCENRNIAFIEADVADFVNELYQRCATAGITMRQKTSISPKNEIEQIAKTMKEEVGSGLEKLVDYLENKDEDLYNSAMLLQSRHSRLKQKEGKGTIDSRNADVEHNQIADAALNLITEAKKL